MRRKNAKPYNSISEQVVILSFQETTSSPFFSILMRDTLSPPPGHWRGYTLNLFYVTHPSRLPLVSSPPSHFPGIVAQFHFPGIVVHSHFPGIMGRFHFPGIVGRFHFPGIVGRLPFPKFADPSHFPGIVGRFFPVFSFYHFRLRGRTSVGLCPA